MRKITPELGWPVYLMPVDEVAYYSATVGTIEKSGTRVVGWCQQLFAALQDTDAARGDVGIMDEVLSTPACLLGVLGPWGRVRNGELTLSEGVLTFTRPGARDPLFSVPVDEVRARMPRLYFGMGLKLTARGKRYRIWFVQMRWGQTGGGGGTFSVGRGFNLKDIGPARSAAQTWRTALSGQGRDGCLAR